MRPISKRMARFESAGKKLSDEEKSKRDDHPFEAYARLKRRRRTGTLPSRRTISAGAITGCSTSAPAQDSFMCRLRIPDGILTHWQFRGVADIAERFGGGYTARDHTRQSADPRDRGRARGRRVEGLADLGICSRGSGADNIRNVTGTPTAGIDPAGADRHAAAGARHGITTSSTTARCTACRASSTSPSTAAAAFRRWKTPTTSAFTAVDGRTTGAASSRACSSGSPSAASPATRTSRATPACSSQPEDASPVADAIVRVFIEHGDRTDRKKARLKYVLDRWGFEKFLAEVEAKLGRRRCVADVAPATPRPRRIGTAHIGVHPQKQPGLV